MPCLCVNSKQQTQQMHDNACAMCKADREGAGAICKFSSDTTRTMVPFGCFRSNYFGKTWVCGVGPLAPSADYGSSDWVRENSGVVPTSVISSHPFRLEVFGKADFLVASQKWKRNGRPRWHRKVHVQLNFMPLPSRQPQTPTEMQKCGLPVGLHLSQVKGYPHTRKRNPVGAEAGSL